MSRKNLFLSRLLLIGSLVWSVAETWYFGWNEFPESITERRCDMASAYMLITSLVFYLQYLNDKIKARP